MDAGTAVSRAGGPTRVACTTLSPCHAAQHQHQPLPRGTNLWHVPALPRQGTSLSDTAWEVPGTCHTRVTRRHSRAAAHPSTHQTATLSAGTSQLPATGHAATNGLSSTDDIDGNPVLRASNPAPDDSYLCSDHSEQGSDGEGMPANGHAQPMQRRRTHRLHINGTAAGWTAASASHHAQQPMLHPNTQSPQTDVQLWPAEPAQWPNAPHVAEPKAGQHGSRVARADPAAQRYQGQQQPYQQQQEQLYPQGRQQQQQQYQHRQQQQQEPHQPHEDQGSNSRPDKHERKMTSRLQDCNTWQQVVSVLQRYAVFRGTLSPPDRSDPQGPGAGSGLDMPEPALLLQPLNARHLVVLWCTLARVVNLGDEHPIGVFRRLREHTLGAFDGPQGVAADGSAPQGHTHSTTNHNGRQGGQSFEPAPDSDDGGERWGLGARDDPEGSWPETGETAAAAGAAAGAPLSRVELVALRRVLSRLEQLSWQCMSSGGWLATDAVSALWAMGQLGHVPSDRWLPTWLAVTQPALPNLSGRHLCSATWALAVTGLRPSPAWLSTSVVRAGELAAGGQLTPSGHAVAVWSLARLATVADTAAQGGNSGGEGETRLAGGVPTLAPQQLADLLGHALHRLGHMQPHHVSMMVWAVGHLSAAHHPAVQPLAQPLALSQQRPQHQQPLGGPAGAGSQSGQVGLRLRDCVDTLWAEIHRLGPQTLGPQGTANSLWAAAHMAAHQPPLTSSGSSSGSEANGSSNGNGGTSGFEADVQPACTAPSRQQAAAVRHLLDMSTAVLPHMTAQQLYNCAWAAASLQVVPSQAWIHGLLVSSRSKLDSFEMQALAGIMWACCKLGVKPGPAWMGAAMRVVDRNTHELCPRSLPLLLWSLATLGFNPGLAWGKALTLSTSRLMPRLGPQAAAMCAQSLARLRLPAHPAWCAAMLACMQQHMQKGPKGHVRHMRHMRPQELAASLQGVAKLGLQPDGAWMEAAEQLLMTSLSQQLVTRSWQQQQQAGGAAVEDPSRLGSRQLAGCLYGLARLGHVASEPFMELSTQELITGVQQQLHAKAQGGGGGPEQVTAAAAVTAVDLVQGCWALAMMGHTPAPSQLQQLTALSKVLLPHMGHAELAQCVWALQRMGLVSPGPDWIHALLTASAARLAALAGGQPTYNPLAAGGAAAAAAAAAQPRPAAPLLSVGTLLRALVLWGCSAASSSGGANGRAAGGAAGRVEVVPYGWLQLAAAVVEAEASRQLYSGEGPLPSAAQLSAGMPSPSSDAAAGAADAGPLFLPQQVASAPTPPPPPARSLPGLVPVPSAATAAPARSFQPPTAHAPARPAPTADTVVPSPSHARAGSPDPIHVPLLPDCPAPSAPRAPPFTHDAASARSRPFTYESGRLGALSLSYATLGHKRARQRLWQGHRMYVLQHDKVVKASRRALRQLLGNVEDGPARVGPVAAAVARAGSGSSSGPVTARPGLAAGGRDTTAAAAADAAAAVQPGTGLMVDMLGGQREQGGAGIAVAVPPAARHVARDLDCDDPGAAEVSQAEQYHQYEGLLAEIDMRYMPW